jgi:energy-coupling factor transporter transmembrane protein EcfT
VYLQPPPGRRYVRTFLFSRRVDAPLARIHLVARTILVLCLSAAQLRTINTDHPDLAGAIVLWLCGLLLFALSGMHAKIARLYLLLTLPTLCSLLVTWTLLNPIPGHVVLLQQPIYAGVIHLSLAVWQLLWLAMIVGYYFWRRGIVMGVLIATVVMLIVTHVVALPEWTFASVRFFHPVQLYISDVGLERAITKVIGYSAMILSTVALVVTSRDVELIGALRQLRVPQVIIFFLSTVFRALNLALNDYETIYQAQIARAINARPRNFFRQLRDLGSIAVPMVAMMIRRSSEIGDALLARGYTLGQNMENYYETSPWRTLDWLILVLSLGLLYLAIGPFPGLTALLQRG